MSVESIVRKLTAILYADVAGYSRLTGDDELDTHRRVMTALDRAAQVVDERGGKVLRYAGDAMLAEFASVVACLESAVTMQTTLAQGNEGLPAGKKVQLRVGVHLGEVLVDRGEIYGDGVNVAARLESISEPGGVCISASVFRETSGKVDTEFRDGGEISLKNIPTPVHVYRWHPVSTPAVQPEAGAVNVSNGDSPASLGLPGKPSIAVLPFDNMSADPEQEFFADGISEDIITELSRFRSLFVIARNSSFAFKGRPVDVKEVSDKLGVRYVVEGSVRRAGHRMRITAQLIDAVENKHLWAERFDRNVEDIFELQDEVTQAIVLAIEPTLAITERQRASRKPPESLDAWECHQRALRHLYGYTPEDCRLALGFSEKAIDLDPSFSSAHAGLAFTLYYYVLMGFCEDRDHQLKRALEAAKTAVSLDPNDPFAQVALGRVHTIGGNHDAAIEACDTALALNPSFANAHFGRAHSLWHAGRPREGIESHDAAIRLSPRDPLMWAFLASKAIALIMLERYEEAIEYSKRAQRQPNAGTFSYAAEVSGLGQLGREEDARDAVQRLLKHNSSASTQFFRRALPVTHRVSRERFFGGLLKAGLPD